METKYYLIFLALLLSLVFNSKAVAQRCLVFRYDADGNRINRTVTTNCQGMRETEEKQETIALDDGFKVYPNPTSGSFKVIMPESIRHENTCYELFDINGAVISSGDIYEYETDIDVGDNPSGVYLLKITNGDDVISKIILKH